MVPTHAFDVGIGWGACHLYRSADIPVRFGASVASVLWCGRNEEADTNVRAPKGLRSPVFDKADMRPVGCRKAAGMKTVTKGF